MNIKDLEENFRPVLVELLEARLVVCEMWRVGMNFEIDSPLITPEERDEAILQRDTALVEWGEVMTRLEEVRSGDFGI